MTLEKDKEELYKKTIRELEQEVHLMKKENQRLRMQMYINI